MATTRTLLGSSEFSKGLLFFDSSNATMNTAFQTNTGLNPSVTHHSIRNRSSCPSTRHTHPHPNATPSQISVNKPGIYCAQTTSRPPPTYTPLPPSVPQVAPYPNPVGAPGAFATLARDAETIPAFFRALCTHPKLSSLPALIDEHHTPSASLTFEQLGIAIQTCSTGLRTLGLSAGDIVSFFSENSHRWGIFDQAIMSCGSAAAVRGVSAPAAELAYIFQDSQSCALVIEKVSALQRVISAGADLSKVKFVAVLFGTSEEASTMLPPNVRVVSYEEIMRLGQTSLESGNLKSDGESNGKGNSNGVQALSRKDIATLLYTSGTTGYPKGVVLTHDNILQQLQYISLGSFDPKPGEVFVSILPCWHVFERTAAYWCLSKGVSLVYSNKRNFRNDLAKHRPHLLISVPRVFENLHATITSKLRNASSLRKKLFGFFYAISLWFVRARRRISGQDVLRKASLPRKLLDVLCLALLTPLHALANLLIWRKIRSGVGGRLRICLSGGGSIAGHLEDFFECAGIPICVGYGLTETSPVIANRFGQRNVRGSTGMPLPHLDVKLVDGGDGKRISEIGKQGVLHVRGPSVFREYWKNSDATRRAFDSEGYFSTGDLAYYSHGGDIVMCGRSKDLIVLSNGENIEPSVIEDALASSPLIDQVMLVGQDQRSLGALVIPKLDALEEAELVSADFRRRVDKLLQDHQGNSDQLSEAEEELSGSEKFWEAIMGEIRSRNSERVHYTPNDKIVHVQVVLTPFSVENGMLTETLKVKKNVVNEVYAKRIADMYS